MRKWNMKRVFVVAAAVCVLGTITAVAAGKVVYTSGGGSHLDDFTYDKLREMETKLGYTTNAPETFSNGYRFDMGMPIHQDAMDQDGNVIKSTEGFSLNYKKDGNPDVFITVQGTSLYDEEGQPDQTFDHNGITLNYTRDQYRFVPRIIRFPMRRRQRKQQENSISLMEAIRYRIRLPKACSGRMGRRFTS